MIKVVDDPVFGRLQLSAFWEGRIDTPLLGTNVRLQVDTNGERWLPSTGEPPSAAQHAAFRCYLSSERSFRPSLEAEMLRLYREAREVNSRLMSAAELARAVPPLAASHEVWRLYSCPKLMIPCQEDEYWKVIQSWEVPWRPVPIEFVLSDKGIDGPYGPGDHGLY